MKKHTLALSIYIVLSVVHLTGIVLYSSERQIVLLSSILFISKALLMPSLALYARYMLEKVRAPYHRFLFVALGFSWIGDVLLTWRDPYFFLGGLIAFLTAHVFYILTYYHESRFITYHIISGRPYVLIPYAMVVGFFLFKTYARLQWFIVPVGIYSVVLAAMSAMALNRYRNVNPISFWLTYIGSLLFMFSDFLIGWTEFYRQLPFSRFIIMITYISGQLLITEGLIRKKRLVHIK